LKVQLVGIIFRKGIVKTRMIVTMKRMTPNPEIVLETRLIGGKNGSLMPVIGFLSKAVHLAAYSGLGRS